MCGRLRFFRLLAIFGMFGRFGLMFLTAFKALVGAADIPAYENNVRG